MAASAIVVTKDEAAMNQQLVKGPQTDSWIRQVANETETPIFIMIS
jgi:hypothetical protein